MGRLDRGPDGRRRRLLGAVGVWVGMVGVALANAALRELVLTPNLGPARAHVASTATLVVVLGAVAFLYFGVAPAHTRGQLLAVGLLWAGLTVAFEFGFGHFVAGESWAALADQYDLSAGKVWVAVPLALLAAPWLFGRGRGR